MSDKVIDLLRIAFDLDLDTGGIVQYPPPQTINLGKAIHGRSEADALNDPLDGELSSRRCTGSG